MSPRDSEIHPELRFHGKEDHVDSSLSEKILK